MVETRIQMATEALHGQKGKGGRNPVGLSSKRGGGYD
jgi:hypothetical protein